ncbi:transposase [Membranihabitans marinus]|uniref:transposase n=1 Tax=Membranihabitans marinus TaxID=1227546 RepID=UPI001F02AE5D|nr:transposase [Membranihabitans marinus]
MTKQRKKYSSEFKEMIISLIKGGQSRAEIGREYGLSKGMISRWVKQSQITDRPIFTGNGNASLTEEQKKYKELEKAYLAAKMENDILKKAMGIFSLSDRTNTSS